MFFPKVEEKFVQGLLGKSNSDGDWMILVKSSVSSSSNSSDNPYRCVDFSDDTFWIEAATWVDVQFTVFGCFELETFVNVLVKKKHNVHIYDRMRLCQRKVALTFFFLYDSPKTALIHRMGIRAYE